MKFNTALVVSLLSMWFIVANNKIYTQEYKDDIPTSSENYSDMTNINSSLTHGRFQDIKRGVIQFWIDNSRRLKSSGVLLNSVDNNNNKAYILTAQHYLKSSVGDELNIWLSFDYELPDNVTLSNYIEKHKEFHIERLYKTPVKVLVSESNSDIALLEVDFADIPLNIHTAFFNSFAFGWNLHPDYKNQGFHVISHPKYSPKKIVYDYVNDVSLSITRDPRQNSSVPLRKFIGLEQKGFTTNTLGQLVIGCCGASLLDKNGLSFAVSKSHSRTAWFSLIENVWIENYDNLGQNTLGVMNYLDTKNTWMSSIPGGFLKDLIPNQSNVNFDLEINNSTNTKTINLNVSNLFFNLKNSISNVLPPGILPTEPNIPATIIYLTPNKDPSLLLYGVIYEGDMSFQSSIFKGKMWQSGENPFEIPNFPTHENHDSVSFKAAILTHFNNSKSDRENFKGLKDFNFDANINIQAKSGTARVRAIKLPDLMPYNAVELFEPERFKDLWRSYKYKPSRGINSDNLHINNIKVEFEQYVYANDQCVALPKKVLQEISTGNNGGYLNLVNPNFNIEEVVASEPVCPKNKLTITLNTNSTEETNYAAWLDYHKDKKEGNQTNAEDNYTYNFVDDTTEHLDEKLGLGSINGGTIIIESELPNEGELIFDQENTLKTRLRVAVANQSQTETILTQGGVYAQGEVEDYMVTIRKTSNEDRKIAASIGANILMITAKEDEVCDDANVGEGIDQTAPASNLPILQGGGGIGDGVCENILDFNHSTIGENAINFDGEMYVNVDQGGSIVRNSSIEKTISIDFLKETIESNQDEILYEEGGSGESGFSIRLKSGKIIFGVKIGNELLSVESSSAITASEMTNVTAVFDEGKLELYVNGLLEDTTQFSNQNTTIPEHLDDAGLGGIAGSTIWGGTDPIKNFDGVVDYFAYWNQALTASLIGILATKTPTSRTANKQESKPAKEPDFSVSPNPATDELNILVEVQQSGSLKIEIFDLSGKKVYEMKEANIAKGHQMISLNNLKIGSGSYILKVQAGNVRKTEKVVFE